MAVQVGFGDRRARDGPSGDDAPPSSNGRGRLRWPVVGRDHELAAFPSALQDAGGGWLLTGPAGIGKSTLAAACHEAVATAGYRVLQVRGTTAGGAIPFAELAPVLSDSVLRLSTPLEMLAGAVQHLAEQASAQPTVLCVDDLHLLHDTSATVLQQLVMPQEQHTRCPFLLLTARTGEPLPDPVHRLWVEGRLRRMPVTPLDREACVRLAEHVLDGPLHRRTEEEIWNLTRGHPLLLRELIEGGVVEGALEQAEGVWRHTPSLASTPQVLATADMLLSPLADEERAVLELLAVGEPISLWSAGELVDPLAVEALERRGVIDVDRDTARKDVAYVHPLLAVALRERMPRSRLRAVHRSLVTALESTPLRRAEDALRLAAWVLETGDLPPADLALDAARQALAAGRLALAERLARCAVDADDAFDASLVLGQALLAQGCLEEAETVLARLDARADNDFDRTRLAVVRVASHLPDVDRAPAALEVLEEARAAVEDADRQDELRAAKAVTLAHTGDLQGAVSVGERLDESEPDNRAVLSILVASTLAKALFGHADEALRDIERGLALSTELRDVLPLAETRLRLNQRLALSMVGRFEEAVELARASYDRTVESRWLDLTGAWAANLGVALLERGRLREADKVLADARVDLARQDPLEMAPLAHAVQAIVAAQLGRGAQARRILCEHDERWGSAPAHRFTDWLARARAWGAESQGAEPATKALLEFAGREADAATPPLVWALHDAARLGAPGLVTDELAHAAVAMQGLLAPLLADHAAVLAVDDPGALEGTATRFAELGADLLAAEAAVSAATAYQRAGDVRAAKRASARAQLLARECQGARTPGLREAPGLLTARELEVAELASRGLTSRDASTALGVSVRTVDNHLYRVYDKLGISGRADLAELLSG